MIQETQWHETHGNLTALYRWLVSEHWFASTASTTDFWEKPWKWEREWELYQAWLDAGSAELKEALEDALLDERTAGDVLAEFEETNVTE